MARAQDIVNKLWHLCNILRDSGITYPEYVTELTYLLFLKMAAETGFEKDLAVGFRWKDLSSSTTSDQFSFYNELLAKLGRSKVRSVQEIFAGARSFLSQPRHLKLLVEELDSINWYEAREEEALADLYEGLLEKNSTESKAGAGQYFTPRPLIESIVEVVKPRAGETIQDPACGTAGFLIAANRFIKLHSKDVSKKGKRTNASYFSGIELVRDTHRLALMNAMLHGIDGKIICGDALGDDGVSLPPVDVILTNPPFGTKRGGGLPTRAFPVATSNKQLAFLQHVYLGLKTNGRAAIVMPELLGSVARAVCTDLMDRCRLHTILRLPTGIFYAAGVKTNVLFFEKGIQPKNNTRDVWAYDLRSEMPNFGRRNPLTREYFREFEKLFGSDPGGRSKRVDQAGGGRFRRFTRDQIRERGDTLDLPWLASATASSRPNLPRADSLVAEILKRLNVATNGLAALRKDLTD